MSRTVPSGGGGQSDYNALRNVISAPPVIRENISALPPPCSKMARYGADEGLAERDL